ncbi:MAG: hypothetical protein C0417_06795 [Chlorobiaceae bacterium]|nr:hypothetical protein [Chlorobiaceae bacterium]
MKVHPTHISKVKGVLNARLLRDITSYIEDARSRAAVSVNEILTLRNWLIGDRIQKEFLKKRRAEYGEQIVATLSQQLTEAYGSGFTRDSLFRMIQFAKHFHQKDIVVTLSRQLSWSHFVELVALEDNLKREFYTELCRGERWSVRTLRQKMDGLLYERTGISRKPASLAKKELALLRTDMKMSPDLVFRDPYFLDFLGLKNSYSEKDLETAILHDIENFILEFGKDFAFVARQKRITIDHVDYYIDLLFYHRGMKRLVAIDIKLGKFQAADKGQMELYLRWLDRYERRIGEKNPLGLILCADKSDEHIQLLQLERSGIRVAQYLTVLPPKKILMQKLHDAIHMAQERYNYRQLPKGINIVNGNKQS